MPFVPRAQVQSVVQTTVNAQSSLSSSPSAGATSFTVNAVPVGLGVDAIIVIDPFTTEAELRRVTSLVGTTVTVSALTYAHASGDAVLVHDGGLIPWTWWGGIGDADTANSTTNTTAFNRLGTEILGLGNNFGVGGIFVPDGIWYVDNELIIQHSQTVAGTSPDRSIIKAHTTFPFSGTGEVAIMHGTRSGSGNTSYANGGPLSRYYLRDFLVDGVNIANSNGILVSMQQPAHWENVRINNCLGLYGFCVSGGQHSNFKNLQTTACTTGFRLRGATIMFFDGVNVEQTKGTKSILLEDVPGTPCFDLAFHNVHLEIDQETIGVSCEGGATGISFYDFWYSNGATGTGIKFDTASANPGGNCRYVITNYRCNTNNNTFKMIDDIQRGFSLNSQSDTDRMIMFMAATDTVVTLLPGSFRVQGKTEFSAGGPTDSKGAGSPEASLIAPIGSTYRRTDGGAGTSFYVKESGTGSTGWVAK